MDNKIKNILFDMDGTLVTGDTDLFFYVFFNEMVMKYLKNFGGDPDTVEQMLLKCIGVMQQNNGVTTNETIFYKALEKLSGVKETKLRVFFDDFYKNEFKKTHMTYDPIPKMNEVLDYLSRKGYNLILATDPTIPLCAIEFKLKDCDIDKNIFSYITTNENSNYTKLNVEYYNNILKKCGLKASESIMVGNHAEKDKLAEKAGIKTILIKDYLVNKNNINLDNLMTINEFLNYIKQNF